jgi:hypothetical protein
MVKRRHNTISNSEIVTFADRKRQEKVRSTHRLRIASGARIMISTVLRPVIKLSGGKCDAKICCECMGTRAVEKNRRSRNNH